MIKKIISLVLIILFITLTPISSFLQIENNVYAISATLTFEDALHSEMFKHSIIAVMIGYGLTWNDPDAVNMTFEKILADFETKGPDYKPPNKPEGPDLKQLINDLLASASIAFTADGVYKNILSLDDMMADFIKHFVDENYDVGNYGEIDNVIQQEYSNSFKLLDLDKSSVNVIKNGNQTVIIRWTINEKIGNDYKSTLTTTYPDGTVKYSEYIKTNYPYDNYVFRFHWNSGYPKRILVTDGSMISTDWTIPTTYEPIEYIPNTEYELIAVDGIVDNPNYDWVNTQTQERTVVIPIEVDPLTGEPQKDENEIPIPGIGTTEWVGVKPQDIPNMDPHGMPYTPPKITPENPLPVNPELPENPTLEQIQDFTIIEYLKNLFQANKNAAEMQDPTIMGTPSADGTGNGGTGTPTKFDWGDFSKFFDIFFIFIYFIVILILILLKFLKVVFSNLPNIPANTDLFTEYPTILDGVNYIKNLKVGGMSVTVQQAFEYVFLIFFFIFVLKQLRKLYGAYVLEEHERDRDNKKDMKLDYYDNQYKYKDNDHENIKFKGWD